MNDTTDVETNHHSSKSALSDWLCDGFIMPGLYKGIWGWRKYLTPFGSCILIPIAWAIITVVAPVIYGIRAALTIIAIPFVWFVLACMKDRDCGYIEAIWETWVFWPEMM